MRILHKFLLAFKTKRLSSAGYNECLSALLINSALSSGIYDFIATDKTDLY